MLICPQCAFENPNTNKFCQSCGASLTHQVCPQCSTEVPLNAQLCHHCGAKCGKVWQAIIVKSENGDWGTKAGEAREHSTGGQDDPKDSSQTPISLLDLKPGSFLDQEQRYQLLEPLSPLEENMSGAEMWVKVLDCQPYQISPIEAMVANQQQHLLLPAVEMRGISPLAHAYIVLQYQTHPGIPAIHDAWQQYDTHVLLVEDRSNWQCLLEFWQVETTSTLQILHIMCEMTELWSVLETVNCRQSLLDLWNLRLDKDQRLALQRLYVESVNEEPGMALSPGEKAATIPGKVLTIQALAQVWHSLFTQSQRTQFSSIIRVWQDLRLGKIQTVQELRSRLQEIIAELEAPGMTIAHTGAEKNTAAPTIIQLQNLEDIKAEDLPTVLRSMQLSSLEDAGLTDVGLQRHHNEDYFGIDTKIYKRELPHKQVVEARGLYVLCDGMGGHAGGEVASELAVNTLRQYFEEHWIGDQMPTEDMINEAVRSANQAIYELNQQEARSGTKRMGTTLVMLLIQGSKAAVAHVGDSRLYRLTHKRGLEQITVDHEVGQREIARGVQANIAYARPDAYQLTQALGPRDQNSVYPDVEFLDITEDSLFILVSDGLSDNDLLESHGHNHLIPLLSCGGSLEQALTELIDLANQHNGHDNITAILVRAKL
ncbi:serine/threonine phosphatase [Chrysosporum bergii ANA360D]|uniref:Serine/threonine phosphatase n=1 Tax=Chrysosporum bergii ANA360D TaxID=617107 RepID=A0AA43GPN9_9CYAN|nr:serine/threonine phosphatase [Chrysosporum bergii]MDH6059422.1 serine/threonine phosphatase [Chrysosporum bergii ANA360D]